MRLHKEYGLNLHLTICPRCGQKGDEIAILGNCNKGTNSSGDTIKLEPCDKVMGNICTKCQEEIALHKELVAAGGLYWKCTDCGANGVIKSNQFTKDFRNTYKLTKGEPCGVELPAKNCPKCGDK